MNARLQIKKLNGGATTASAKGCFTPQLGPSASSSSDGVRFPALAYRSIRTDPDWTVKRLYDAFCSFCGLVLLSPVFAVIAALVKIADGGDVFYRQVRVGRGGREFLIYKFRTMMPAAEKSGPSVTKNGDARVTRIGRILRKAKLDELPQLWNVLKGDMSLVGPRPEVLRYVRHYTAEQRAILQHKPGITDLASLCFRDEEALLANAVDVEEFYVRHCIPRKLRLNQEYAERANLLSDTWIILQTVCPYWIGVLACYGIILAVSFWLSDALIYNFASPLPATLNFRRELCVTVVLQLACLMWHRQCQGLLSYFNHLELRRVGASLGLAAGGLLTWSIADNGEPPLNFILINALLSVCMISGFRALLRSWRERSARAEDTMSDAPARVGIIGAGSTGAQLALELRENFNASRRVVAFFDDDFHKWQKYIHDVPVAGMPECLIDGWSEKLDEVVIAATDAPEDRVREIEQLLRKTTLKYYTVTSPARFWNRPQMA
jgi:lipopolysaccharide/colanic/teichoic acid biosynthesis glycosyltransferase